MAKYRSDIDGMRAVAVLSVVLYHCGFGNHLPGGFIGVDIFFVISGFLITGIVDRQSSEGKFSIFAFYRRRILRIFPALYVMYFSIALASFFLFMPSQTGTVTRDILSSILFISNINFYYRSGYFDQSSETNPLLHTWSLSVEEQFYIILPLAILLICKLSWKTKSILLLLFTLAGIALSEFMVSQNPSAAFYLLQFRFWELLIGSTASMLVGRFAVGSVLANAAAVSGLGMILASLLLLDSASSFPGLNALPACLGTTLLIISSPNGQDTLVGRLLSIRPARFIGAISYSLYLWHWPIWLFGRYIYEPRGSLGYGVFILVSIVVATLSWRFVERPFRTMRITSNRRVVATGASLAVAAGGLVLLLPVTSALYWRVPENIERVAGYADFDPRAAFRTGKCFLTADANDLSLFDANLCLSLSPEKPDLLILGDSHAAHLYPGFKDQSHFNILQATASGCKPVLNSRGEKRCTGLMASVFDDYLTKNRPDIIILSARWAERDLENLARTIAELSKHTGRLIVLGPMLEYDRSLPRLLASALYNHDPQLARKHRRPDPLELDKKMKSRITGDNVEYVSLVDQLCTEGDCTEWAASEIPLQFDYGHLTVEGSSYVIGKVEPLLVLDSPEMAKR